MEKECIIGPLSFENKLVFHINEATLFHSFSSGLWSITSASYIVFVDKTVRYESSGVSLIRT